jgi:hypothetical protein
LDEESWRQSSNLLTKGSDHFDTSIEENEQHFAEIAHTIALAQAKY